MNKAKRLPLRERPAYRVAYQAEQANLVELLAALVGGSHQIETAEGLVEVCGGDLQLLGRMNVEELCRIPGVGQAAALRIRSAIHIGKRLVRPAASKPVVHNPQDAARLLLHEMSALDQEEIWVLVLNTRNRVLRTVQVYRGQVDTCAVRAAEVLRPAVRLNAPALIVAHNHPSGDHSASPEDVAVTRGLAAAAKLLEIHLLDHLVIGHGGFTSLKEKFPDAFRPA